MSRSNFRLFLWRWHRRIGLLSALFVLLLSITGILLNHTTALGLDQKALHSSLILSAYGVETPDVITFPAGEQTVSSLGGEHFYLNTTESAYCQGALKGVLLVDRMLVIACQQELVLLTEAGEVIERLGSAYGLPLPVDAVAHCAGKACMRSGTQWYGLDVDHLKWPALDSVDPEAFVLSSAMAAPPEQIRRTLLSEHLGDGITVERVVLDLHSGHLFGLGPWLMDIVALFLIALAISGFVMWRGRRRRTP